MPPRGPPGEILWRPDSLTRKREKKRLTMVDYRNASQGALLGGHPAEGWLFK